MLTLEQQDATGKLILYFCDKNQECYKAALFVQKEMQRLMLLIAELNGTREKTLNSVQKSKEHR
jgi:hypothetical protein